MKAQSDVLHSVDCDYLTCSAVDDRGLNTLHSFASQLMRSEAESGNELHPWSMKGYRGWRAGNIEIGTFQERVLVRCSAHVAAHSWTKLFELSEKISRIDLQVTVVVHGSVTSRIETHRQQALKFSAENLEKPIVRWIQDNRHGYTLYLGARESNVFGRIYDKYAREGLDHWKQCVRYEVQFNKRLARPVASTLVRTPVWKNAIAADVCRFFEDRGVPLPRLTDARSTYCSHRTRTDADRKLAWLADSVRPSVLSLLAMGRGPEVLRALGLVVGDEEPLDHARGGPTTKGDT